MRTSIPSLALTFLLASTSSAQSPGHVIAIGDEWALSDAAYTTAPASTHALAANVAALFADGAPGSFLVLSDILPIPAYGERGAQGAMLAADMQAMGHGWTVDASSPVTLGNLSQYDGVFLAGGVASGPAHAPVLVQYVQGGGSVLVMGGVGSDPSFGCMSAACEAGVWNHFLNAFGIAFAAPYFAPGPGGTLAQVPLLPTDNPVGAGVTEMTWGNGLRALDLEPTVARNVVAMRGDMSALGGGPQGPVNDVIATYNVQGPVGTGTCVGVPNSTGGSGVLQVLGSTLAADNAVILATSGLPNQSFGYFITSRMQGFTANPGGSQGNLCLSGSIGRYVGNILNTTTQGGFALELDLTRTPTPNGLVSVAAGETWTFQCWHRDANPTTTSNFTGAVAVAFR